MKVGGASRARWDQLLRLDALESGRVATPKELEDKDAVRAGGNVYFVDKAKKGEPTDQDVQQKRAVIDDDTGKPMWVDEARTRKSEDARVDEINGLKGDLGVKEIESNSGGARAQLRIELEQFTDGVDARFQTGYQQGMAQPGQRNTKVGADFDMGDLDVRVTRRDFEGLGLDASEVVPELTKVVQDQRAGDFEKAGVAFDKEAGAPHPSKLEGGDLARWQRVQLAKSETDGDAAFLMNPANHPKTPDERLQKLQLDNEMLEMANELAKFKKRVKGGWAEEMRNSMRTSLMSGGKLGFSQISGLMGAVGLKI